jgi:hypothetical protein
VSGCGGTLAGSSLTGIKKQKNKKLSTLATSTYSTGPISEDCTVTASFELNIYMVSTSANPGGSISPGSAEVSHGDTAQFTITPETGYHIVSVAGCDGQISGGLPAAQAKKRNALNLNYTTPISYVTGQITAACTVTASFEINAYTVSTSINTGGSISPASTTVPHGETAQFTVIPDIGYSIQSVTGCGVTLSGSPLTRIKKKKKTMDLLAASSYTTGPIMEDCTVSATFEINTYTVSTSTNTGGSITPTDTTVTHGETAQFTITPDLGYHLVSVSGCGEGKVETGSGKIFRKKKLKSINLLSAVTYTTGPVTGDCSVMATFEINTYTISTTTTQGGSISPASAQVAYHTTAEFIITPDTGYHIESVEGCNGMLSGNTYTTGEITGECTVSAVFAKDFRSVTITIVSGNGTISADGLTCTGDVCTGTYEYGKKIILTLKPDAGYRVSDVKINSVSIGAVNTITLKNLTADTIIEVIFTEI